MINKILKHKKAFLGGSLALMVASGLLVATLGFKPSVDFTSGSLWQIKATGIPTDQIRQTFADEFGIDELSIAYDGASDVYTLTMREVGDSERQHIADTLSEQWGSQFENLDFWSVSPTVSSELRSKALWAIVLVLVSISLYIAFAFRAVSKPINSWGYGIITLITLSHDVILPAGLFALLGRLYNISVDINFMVALLVVMGFSMHDTIVVFDRIRENLINFRGRMQLEEIVDKSIVDTFARSVNTSLTLVFVLLAIYFWGPITLKYFILTILVGTVAGTYSSIFFASPLLLWVGKRNSG